MFAKSVQQLSKQQNRMCFNHHNNQTLTHMTKCTNGCIQQHAHFLSLSISPMLTKTHNHINNKRTIKFTVLHLRTVQSCV